MHSSQDRAYFERPYTSLLQFEREYLQLANERAWDIFRENCLRIIDAAPQTRRQFAACCWHARDHEDYAMWNIYGRQSGICIRSSFQRLITSLANYTIDPIYIGRVRYIDFQSELVGTGNAFLPVITKRREFRYEQEVRAVINRLHTVQHSLGPTECNPYIDTIGPGLNVQIDTDALIETVYISPYAESFLTHTVTDLLARHKLNIRVLRSAI